MIPQKVDISAINVIASSGTRHTDCFLLHNTQGLVYGRGELMGRGKR